METSAEKIKQGLAQIQSEMPKFHGRENLASWHINNDVLNWLATHAKPDMSTLETGSGFSTVVFALSKSRHISISPAP